MAKISKILFARHLRAEPTSWVRVQKNGKLGKSGAGLAFWFLPLGTAIVEVPLDDRELPFLFRGRSRDFQEVVVQGVITYRIDNPAQLASRLNCTIDSETGIYTEQPLDKLALTLTQLASGRAAGHLAAHDLREILSLPVEDLRALVHEGLRSDDGIAEMGVHIVSTRIAKISPTAEVEKALQMPTRERIQQQADEATFARRALAVEKERAIAENEMSNEIALAEKEETLIDQQGANAKKRAREEAQAQQIQTKSEADGRRLRAAAEAEAIAMLETARVDAEEARIGIYKSLPQGVILGLAAKELAAKLERIEHLNISPDMLGPLLQRLGVAGAKVLEGES